MLSCWLYRPTFSRWRATMSSTVEWPWDTLISLLSRKNQCLKAMYLVHIMDRIKPKFTSHYRVTICRRPVRTVIFYLFFYYYLWGETESAWYCGNYWPIVQALDDRCWWLWSNCRMKTGRENRSTQRKPTPVPLCPPKIPHDLTWAQNQAAAVGGQRLSAWAMARPRTVN
jgi:hypothetical protein